MKSLLNNVFFWTVTTLGTVFFGLITFLSYSEWWTVKVKKQTEGYPWGPVNENPWYFGNPEIYSTVMLIEGIAFTVALVILTIQLIKAKKTGVLYSLLLCTALFILMLVNGNIN